MNALCWNIVFVNIGLTTTSNIHKKKQTFVMIPLANASCLVVHAFYFLLKCSCGDTLVTPDQNTTHIIIAAGFLKPVKDIERY